MATMMATAGRAILFSGASVAVGRCSLFYFSATHMPSMGMGAFLAVAKGSDLDPKFIHLTLKSEWPIKEKIALVRKDVCEDLLKDESKKLNIDLNLYSTNTKEIMINSLREGKSKYLCYEEWGFRFKVNRLGLDNRNYVKVHTFFKVDACINNQSISSKHFTLKDTKFVVKIFSHASFNC